jgi:hypothetical protein
MDPPHCLAGIATKHTNCLFYKEPLWEKALPKGMRLSQTILAAATPICVENPCRTCKNSKYKIEMESYCVQ